MKEIDMLTILTLGNETLKKPSILVADFDKKLQDFIQAMYDTMHTGNGIGLAAPQVGSLIRAFVCRVSGDMPRVFINPEILETSNDLATYEEGCLSIPGVYADVTRSAHITVQAWNEKGKPFTMDADGLLATVIQHEYDHLNGVLFIDRLNDKKRNRILKSYTKKEKN